MTLQDDQLHEMVRSLAVIEAALPRIEEAQSHATRLSETRDERIAEMEARVIALETTFATTRRDLEGIADSLRWVARSVLGLMLAAVGAILFRNYGGLP